MSQAAAVVLKSDEALIQQWLALALTPGLGPNKSRRLVEFFGSVQSVFRATLTELEAAGLRAVSAQSLATGQSAELAQEELGRATAAGAVVVVMDDPAYPSQLKQIYDPPLVLYVRGYVAALSQPGSRWWARGIQPRMDWEWLNVWRVTWRHADW
jgi:DNA processing protein